jgi:hypothetical protein
VKILHLAGQDSLPNSHPSTSSWQRPMPVLPLVKYMEQRVGTGNHKSCFAQR